MHDDASDPLVDIMRTAKVPTDDGLARKMARALVRMRLGLEDPPQVGRYLIESKLAEGGMGAIFRARDPDLDRMVAIKVPHPRVDEDTHGLVAQEARALARLSHPNVLVVHDLGARDGQLWLAMELVAGKSLGEWCEANRDATWRDVVRLFVGAARGLAAAHDAGVVHRDVKPDNIMVGDDGRVRVADFGLALIEGATQDDASRPEIMGEDGVTRRVAGTPDYLPPEVLEGVLPGTAADQYSFFASLYEMVPGLSSSTGGASRIGRSARAINGSQSLPAKLLLAIERGLSHDPLARFESMHEVAAQLEALVAAPPDDLRRRAMLDRVEAAWLDGVLRVALDGLPAAHLSLSDASDLVEPPWTGHAAARAPRYQPTTASLRAELSRARGALLLVGQPGSGKTTALLGLAAELLQRARAEATEPVPVVLNLASMSAHRGGFAEWLIAELVTKYGLPRRRASQWLDDDAMVLLLDGLDEVASDRRRQVALAIDAFRAEHPVTTVVACREDNFSTLGLRLRFGLALRIEPPNEATVTALCEAHGAAGDMVVRTLAAHASGPAPSPLIVSLLLRSGLERRMEDVALTGLYDDLVEGALERPPPLPPRRRERLLVLLTWLAHTLMRNDSSDLWLERMQIDWLPNARQRLAAKALGIAAIFALLLAGNLAGNALAERPPVVALVLAAASLLVVLVFNRGVRIRHGVALRWSWRLSLRRLPLMLGIGLVVGLIFGSLYIMWVNLVLSTTAALVLAIVVGLEPADRVDRLRAGAGLWRALKTSLIVGPITGLIAGLAVGYGAVTLVLPLVGAESRFHTMADPQQSLFWTTSVFVTLLIGLLYGGTAVMIYGALRVVQSINARTPILLARWLDVAVDRGLLRRVGGGWIFLHRSLLEYFARRPAPRTPSEVPAIKQ